MLSGDASIRLLVVEDNDADFELVLAALEDRHVDSVHAPTLNDAKTELERDSFDAVLLDLHLPGVSGLDTLRAILDCAPPPVVVLTGLDDEDLAARCLAAGALDYLSKRELRTLPLLRSLSHAVALHRVHELRRALEHADRLATLGQLAAGIAHEVNNPLGYLQLNLELIRKRMHGDDELVRLTHEAHDGLTRVSDLMNGLRSFARRGTDRARSLDVSTVCRSAASIARMQLDHRITLQLDLHPVAPVRAIARKLEQVLVNLLVNAAQAIASRRKTGTVRLTTSSDETVRIVVSDDGPGIPEADQRKIFEPFYTTKPAGVGTGLGLAIVGDLVREMGGQIHLESTVDVGTTFTIELPPHVSSTGRRRVLIVDDDERVGRALQRILRERHDAELEPSSRAAAERLRSGERFDVVFCDLHMPELGGIELYEKVVRVREDLAARFVFLTGSAPSGSELGDLRVIMKPTDAATILDAIDRVVEDSEQF